MSRALLSLLIWALVFASPIGARLALADEFDVVPMSDSLYKHLTHVQKSGWTGAKTQPDNANHELTRYEIALETAKAIFTINARNRSDAAWAATVSRPTLRSLKELTLAIRSELRKLDIDATTTVQFIDTLLKPAPLGQVAVTGTPITGSNASILPRPATPSATGGSLFTPHSQSSIEFPLSQRLRVQTVLSSLAREAQDPLSNSRLGIAQTGAALDVTSWLKVHAGQEHQIGRQGRFSLRSPLMNDADLLNAPEATVTSGGVDIVVRPGFTFSGNLARVSPEASDGISATRLEGGIGLSGWQNRLVLSANVSRLVPEDSVALSTTAANFNLDARVTERLSLKLLYQQLFGAQQQRQADRVVAGGITINF